VPSQKKKRMTICLRRNDENTRKEKLFSFPERKYNLHIGYLISRYLE
jgi:hypothetical protein